MVIPAAAQTEETEGRERGEDGRPGRSPSQASGRGLCGALGRHLLPPATHLRRSLALSEALEALQELSSGLLRAVGRVWSSTGRSLPCFHSS